MILGLDVLFFHGLCCIYRKKVARYGAFLYMKPFLWGVKKLWGVYTTPHFFKHCSRLRASILPSLCCFPASRFYKGYIYM